MNITSIPCSRGGHVTVVDGVVLEPGDILTWRQDDPNRIVWSIRRAQRDLRVGCSSIRAARKLAPQSWQAVSSGKYKYLGP